MPKKPVSETLHAKGIDIGIYTSDFKNEFISLTDIAKYRNEDDPRFVIQNWMRNRNTIEFLAVWEELHNPGFNRVQFEAVKTEAGLNRFVMTPTKWIGQMNAIGIVSRSGRYGGGTYAHSDIAMSFAAWISPEFQLYIMKDYRRLKEDENSRLSLNWNPLSFLSMSASSALSDLGQSMGFVLNLHPGVLNLTLGADYIPFHCVSVSSLLDEDFPDQYRRFAVLPRDNMKLNFYIGLNLAFGRSRLDHAKRFVL